MYQLLHPLEPNAVGSSNMNFQIKSIDALIVVMQECAPRIARWKGRILDAVAKCWVTLRDAEKQGEELNEDLKKSLRKVCKVLAEICPHILEVSRNYFSCPHVLNFSQEEYQNLLSLDADMFQNLFRT